MLDLALSNGLRLSAENAQPTKSRYPESNRENRNDVLVGPPQILTKAYTFRPRGKLRASELPHEQDRRVLADRFGTMRTVLCDPEQQRTE